MVGGVDEVATLGCLLELAREAGVEVRPIGSIASSDSLAPPASGVCRVRGAVWVLLSRQETPDLHTDVLARALREHAEPMLAERFLTPAVRARIFPEGEERGRST